MSTTNHLGNLGEDIVSLLFSRKIDNAYKFSPTFLGEKAQLLDFMVNLLDDTGSAYGPFFFVQVKTTETRLQPKRSIPARFSAQEVRVAQARKCPVYLVAVASIDDDSEAIFAIAVDASYTNGLAAVPQLFSLLSKEIRMQIYNEVHAYFTSAMPGFASHLTRQAAAQKSPEVPHDQQS